VRHFTTNQRIGRTGKRIAQFSRNCAGFRLGDIAKCSLMVGVLLYGPFRAASMSGSEVEASWAAGNASVSAGDSSNPQRADVIGDIIDTLNDIINGGGSGTKP
jgi:hypothetical protein